MENTTEKLYIVSFGDSRKFRYPCTVKNGIDAMHHAAPFAKIENELHDYLKTVFPDQTFAYYTCARVTEVDQAHADKYADYPLLDQQAIDEIKKELVKEIKDADETKMLNDTAPFADAPV